MSATHPSPRATGGTDHRRAELEQSRTDVFDCGQGAAGTPAMGGLGGPPENLRRHRRPSAPAAARCPSCPASSSRRRCRSCRAARHRGVGLGRGLPLGRLRLLRRRASRRSLRRDAGQGRRGGGGGFPPGTFFTAGSRPACAPSSSTWRVVDVLLLVQRLLVTPFALVDALPGLRGVALPGVLAAADRPTRTAAPIATRTKTPRRPLVTTTS